MDSYQFCLVKLLVYAIRLADGRHIDLLSVLVAIRDIGSTLVPVCAHSPYVVVVIDRQDVYTVVLGRCSIGGVACQRAVCPDCCVGAVVVGGTAQVKLTVLYSYTLDSQGVYIAEFLSVLPVGGYHVTGS